ncbi:unnamed protein product [Prorocentrum cordatum]|uniref:Uncharacterized protein n=1 Tax=Prorocentrum cordatum TaxID=2364126 RepID=A0ABN9XGK1_9DINO|nr:unnamed protein product [Polarella glacialis]
MQCALIVHIAIACLLPQSSAVRMLSGWDRPRGEGVRDRQLLSAPLERQEARARGEAAAATQNGTRRPRKHPERDHPGMFRACGVDWLDYEPLHLNSTGDATHYAACAPASGDASTIGICRSDGHGHDSWEYCMDPPAAKCGGLVGSHGPPAKLFFVVCTQVLVRLPDDHDDHDDHDDGIHTAAPTAAPTASPSTAPTAGPVEAPKSAPTVAPTVSPTAAPTATPTAAATPAPSAAPTAPANVASPPLTTLAAEADAGATSLMVVSMAGLSVGDEIVISGGGVAGGVPHLAGATPGPERRGGGPRPLGPREDRGRPRHRGARRRAGGAQPALPPRGGAARGRRAQPGPHGAEPRPGAGAGLVRERRMVVSLDPTQT